MNFRLILIKKLIEINESIFFYPKLRKTYNKILNKQGLIIDVGTNSGQSIDFFYGISKEFRIFGYEPNVSLYKKLEKKYNYGNILIFNKGISDFSGEMYLNINVLDLTSSFEELNYQSVYLKHKSKVLGLKSSKEIIKDRQLVEVNTLNDEFNKLALSNVELLKIDVEGHELNCLMGLSIENAAKIKYLQIEQHEDDMYLNKNQFSKISETIEKLGFIEIMRFKHGFGDFYEILYQNKCYSQ